MVTSYGMSDELGPVTIGEKAGEVFLGASLQDLGSIGPATLDTIDGEVERLVTEASDDRRESCSCATGPTVIETAKALIEHETLSGVALDAVLSTVKRHPDRRHWRSGGRGHPTDGVPARRRQGRAR